MCEVSVDGACHRKLAVRPHSHVVQFLGVVKAPNAFGVAMEFLWGTTLLKFAQEKEVLRGRPYLLVEVLAGVAMGMQHLVDCNLIHGDLHRENVVIDKQMFGENDCIATVCIMDETMRAD